MNQHSPLLLLADIGGTNTRVALADGTRLRTASIRRYRNAEYPGLAEVLDTYLDEEDRPDCDGACVAVAGPVRDGRATLTNLDWTIDADTVAGPTRAERVAVLNDLQAQGYALGHIPAANLRSVIPGPEPKPHETRLVIGIGTGFNAAPVYETAGGRIVPASEAGHVNLPVRTDADLSLLHHVETAHGFPAVEDVLSGRGLTRLHEWVRRGEKPEPEKSAAEIMQAVGSDPAATRTAEAFVRLLGTAAGNLALTYLPFGGVFLVGGVARAFAQHLEPMGFSESFRDKGRFSGFMQNFGVAIVEDDYAALTGCAAHLAGRPGE